jgi:hypothetical protein
MPSKNENRDCCYEEMVKGRPEVHEQSEVAAWNPPAQNEFERAKWNSDGYDQIGAK